MFIAPKANLWQSKNIRMKKSIYQFINLPLKQLSLFGSFRLQTFSQFAKNKTKKSYWLSSHFFLINLNELVSTTCPWQMYQKCSVNHLLKCSSNLDLMFCNLCTTSKTTWIASIDQPKKLIFYHINFWPPKTVAIAFYSKSMLDETSTLCNRCPSNLLCRCFTARARAIRGRKCCVYVIQWRKIISFRWSFVERDWLNFLILVKKKKKEIKFQIAPTYMRLLTFI